MPRLVDLEGFGRIEFPDNATNEQIDSYLKENQDKYLKTEQNLLQLKFIKHFYI